MVAAPALWQGVCPGCLSKKICSLAGRQAGSSFLPSVAPHDSGLPAVAVVPGVVAGGVLGMYVIIIHQNIQLYN